MSKNTTDELREQLAAIEHERWSDWQNYVHKVYLEGNFKEFMLRWQKQIATPYAELSDQEKASDMEQVDRYWNLIEEYISNREKLARLERGIYELERLQYIPQMFGDWENVIDDRIATLRKELDGEAEL